MLPAQRFWQETVSLLDVMWPRSNQWERALLGRNFQLYNNHNWFTSRWISTTISLLYGTTPVILIWRKQSLKSRIRIISRKMVDKRVMNHKNRKQERKRKQGEERRGAKERKEKGVVIRRNQWSMSLSKAWTWEFVPGKKFFKIKGTMISLHKQPFLDQFKDNCSSLLSYTWLAFSHLLSGTERRITGRGEQRYKSGREASRALLQKAGPSHATYTEHVI